MSKTKKHIIALVIAFALLLLVLIILEEADSRAKNKAVEVEATSNRHLNVVSVIEVSPKDTLANITSFGEVKPRWRTALKARSSGEVLTISPKLQEGERVQEGEVLFTFDHSRYQTQLAEARYQITEAERLLQDEKHQADQAKKYWKLDRKKGQPPEFDLRIPQIKAAQAQLKLANTRLTEIKKAGRYAKVTAPYNGIIISKSINLGEVVETGQVLVEMMSSDKLDIKLRLDDKQWPLLDKHWKGQTVDVYAVNGTQKWRAILERDGGVLDDKTRQRILHLSISSQHKPLPGRFVRVEMGGKKLSGLLEVPASTLSPDGYVWFVDKDNRLNRFQAKVVFSREQSLFISPPISPATSPKTPSRFLIVLYPLSSFLPQIEVLPKPLSKKAVKRLKVNNTNALGTL